MKPYPVGMPWLIVRVDGRSFALPTKEVCELVVKPQITGAPELPGHIRGMMDTRGRTVPVVDLRKRLGIRPASEDIHAFVEMMEQRRRDHVNWLMELEASARERREFKLATDPHQCAFGRWYDTYEAENVWIRLLLMSFAAPHRQVHEAAKEVKALQLVGNWEAAMRVIDHARGGVLAKLLRLFGNLQEMIREGQQEVAVVLETGVQVVAVVVDEALTVEKFHPGNMGELPAMSEDGIVSQFGCLEKSGPPVLMVATEYLM